VKKPQKASDWQPHRLTKRDFPLWQQPKIDGVRGLRQIDREHFTARTLKIFKNRALTKFWSRDDFLGLDGELVHPELAWTDPALCRNTSGLTNRIHDPMVPHLVAFDLLDHDTFHLPYERRYEMLQERVDDLGYSRLHLMPFVIVHNMEQVEEYDAQYIRDGYEGSILRKPSALPKEGYSGLALELWRIKRFIDFEFIIDELIEAQQNNNEAKTNALGQTERSSHKANKVGKGMIGMLRGRVFKDVTYNGKLVLRKGQPVDVSAGKLTHAEREEGWANPKLYLKKIGKAKFFPHGTHEKARMPVFLQLRVREDM
jgi:DNA ligase-1